MKVFKYLVALADISVGFLGLFFIIFAVTRPSLSPVLAEQRQLEKTLQQLRAEVRQLEEIKLAKSAAARRAASENSAKIIVALNGVTIEVDKRQTRFRDPSSFARGARQFSWPDNVVLYIDHRLPFEKVVTVIDALKQVNQEITVQIAALTSDK
ncbi:hypothetical protein HUU39_24525 [candidate division KSB1 bacterium]|nr:hypothetical protein [bacterium]NUM68398.1 hypothetical protein [candidate division KSB1 bacterium]